MGVKATWLVDAARLTGYPVNVLPGWDTRGHGNFRVIEGVTGHHTAGPKTGIFPSLKVVSDGRADLAGPLANYGLGRDGTIFCIAAGVAWHAGASAWAGFKDLNDEFIGIEAESAGSVNDWSEQEIDCYQRLVAAILYYIRRDASRFAGHKECALPKGRKIDPAFIDLNLFRAKVDWYLQDPLNRIPRFANPAASAPLLNITEDADVDIKFDVFQDGTFRGVARVEAGDGTATGYSAAWLTLGSVWGGISVKITALHHDGTVLYQWNDGQGGLFRIENNKSWAEQLPKGARMVTIEGQLQDPRWTIPSAAVWHVR